MWPPASSMLRWRPVAGRDDRPAAGVPSPACRSLAVWRCCWSCWRAAAARFPWARVPVFGTRVEVLVWGRPGEGETGDRRRLAGIRPSAPGLPRLAALRTDDAQQAQGPAAASRSSEELAGFCERGAGPVRARGGAFRSGDRRPVAPGELPTRSSPVLPDPARLAALRWSRPRIADLRIDGRRASSSNRAVVAIDFGGYLKGRPSTGRATLKNGRVLRCPHSISEGM